MVVIGTKRHAQKLHGMVIEKYYNGLEQMAVLGINIHAQKLQVLVI